MVRQVSRTLTLHESSPTWFHQLDIDYNHDVSTNRVQGEPGYAWIDKYETVPEYLR